ncbi:CbtB domain-containing protein [Aestuariirhabdus sp. LZHN29]|uniref:CbtB domain-containing protein n=1 Tax=Aestuariirhabdus sp. LZHN29 TaxID=3417462 RepID=UPI003CEF6704
MHTKIETAAIEVPRTTVRTHALRQLLGALLLGSTVLYAVGFLPMATAHNAAHDSRHSHVFPCH